MPKQSKFFRVAVEGATVDGRTIDRQELLEMAALYNRDTYPARVNMEHIRGITADPPFQALGDVMALKTEEVELVTGEKKEKKLALFAQIEPLDNLVKMNAARQKIFTSIEILRNFNNTGKAYLGGLAVTDSPASLGPEMLQFVAGQRENGADPFLSRRLKPDSCFTAALETAIEFEEVAAPATEASGLLAAATAFFKQFSDAKPAEPKQDDEKPKPANDNDVRFAAIGEGLGKMTAAIEAMGTSFAAEIGTLKTDLAGVKLSIATTPAPGQQQRAPATGGANSFTTDC